jgi:hypothetical protein
MVLRDSGAGYEIFLKGNNGRQADTPLYGGGATLFGGSFAVGDSCGLRSSDSSAKWDRAGDQLLNTTRFSAFGVAKYRRTVVACGAGGRLAWWDGTRTEWRDLLTVSPAVDLLAIAADSDGAFWLAGSGGAVFRLDPQLSAAAPKPPPVSVDLHGIACDDGSVGWAVGAGGTVARFEYNRATGAVAWTVPTQGAFPDLYAVFVFGAGAGRPVFAVGARGAIAVMGNRTTGAWAAAPSPTSATLRGVGGSVGGAQSGGIFAAGDNGTVLALDALRGAWLPVPSGTTENLTAVSGNGPTDGNAPTVIAGALGAVLHRAGAGFAPQYSAGCPLRAAAAGDACAFYAREVAGAGADGTSPAVQFNPDGAHTPQLRLYCGGGDRLANLRLGYAAVALRIRRAAGPAGWPTLALSAWNGASRAAPVAAYLGGGGGAVDGVWRTAVVPLADLAVPGGYDFATFETITLGNVSSGAAYQVRPGVDRLFKFDRRLGRLRARGRLRAPPVRPAVRTVQPTRLHTSDPYARLTLIHC